MTRPALLVLVALLASCEDRSAAPPPPANAAATFDNSAAPQSIMQPEVAAESPPEPTPSPTPTATPPLTTTVLFAQGSMLDAKAQIVLDQLIADVPASARLVLRGHSDTSGSDASNLAQSRRRAEAVRDYLVQRGFASTNIEVIALGETRPVAPNAQLDGSDHPAGRARNRRVEVEVLSNAEPEPSSSNRLVNQTKE